MISMVIRFKRNSLRAFQYNEKKKTPIIVHSFLGFFFPSLFHTRSFPSLIDSLKSHMIFFSLSLKRSIRSFHNQNIEYKMNFYQG